jgi:hypothetical protein
MNNELTQEQALSVLIQGVRIAQGKGAYSIEDAEIIAKAIKVFVKPGAEAPTEPVAETTSETQG